MQENENIRSLNGPERRGWRSGEVGSLDDAGTVVAGTGQGKGRNCFRIISAIGESWGQRGAAVAATDREGTDRQPRLVVQAGGFRRFSNSDQMVAPRMTLPLPRAMSSIGYKVSDFQTQILWCSPLRTNIWRMPSAL